MIFNIEYIKLKKTRKQRMKKNKRKRERKKGRKKGRNRRKRRRSSHPSLRWHLLQSNQKSKLSHLSQSLPGKIDLRGRNHLE